MEEPCTSSATSCGSDVAIVVVGEFRNFSEPTLKANQRWQGLTAASAWLDLQRALVQPNGPADLIVHTWESALARTLLTGHLVVGLCATVCEHYDDAYMERVVANYSGFRRIDGNLRLRDKRETPHTVDFFYKRYAGLLLLQRVEAQRGRLYRTVVMTRPDITFQPSTLHVRNGSQRTSTVYLWHSDHHHDSTDKDSMADPMSRGTLAVNLAFRRS